MHLSILEKRGPVTFPEFTGERAYMIPFRQSSGLPRRLERWQSTVDAMLAGIQAPGDIFLMIDQKPVLAGAPQRRPGLHVDGYWCPAYRRHGGSHRAVAGAHGAESGAHAPRGQHAPQQEQHQPHARHVAGPSDWSRPDFSTPEAILLASDYAASRAYVGAYDGTPGAGGDFSHLDPSGLAEVRLQSHTVYAGNVSMLHESLPVDRPVLRTLVRLNVPGWSPALH